MKNVEIFVPISLNMNHHPVIKGFGIKDYNPKFQLRETLQKDRRNRCFFIEHGDMMFAAADELESRRRENQHLTRTRLHMKVAIGVSVHSTALAAYTMLAPIIFK